MLLTTVSETFYKTNKQDKNSSSNLVMRAILVNFFADKLKTIVSYFIKRY